MRPHQYTKNLLLFAAPGAAGVLGDPAVFTRSVMGFLAFCAASSVGYIANDLNDIEADRSHPRKKYRPLASGEVSAQTARVLLACLFLGPMTLSLVYDWRFAAVLMTYVATTLSYTFFFKRVPWIELLFVAMGFLLRAIGGGGATETPLSGWFLIVISASAFVLICGKRLGEIAVVGTKTKTRAVLASYDLASLKIAATLGCVYAVGAYLMWSIFEAGNRAEADRVIWLQLSAIPFACALFRYLALSLKGHGERPEILVLKDRFVVGFGLFWMLFYSFGIYS